MSAPLLWLAHYGLHSSLLLGLAWVLDRAGWPRSARGREALWRVALCGGLLTASLQSAGVLVPLTGRVSLPRWEQAAAAEPAASAEPGLSRGLEALPGGQDPLAPIDRAGPGRAPAAGPPAATRPAVAPWAGLLAAALIGALLLLRAWHGLRSLGPRQVLGTGPLVDLLRELQARSPLNRPVRLTQAPGLTVPVAIGLLRPEISLPARAHSLPADQARAMLAHELGHLVRRDPLWMWIQQGIATVLFLQPLNRLACARLGELAEQCCDDWATERTGEPLALARCLTEVAGWLRAGGAPAACAMARQVSGLDDRVHRILDDGKAPGPRIPLLRLGSLGLLASASLALPAYGPRAEPEPLPGTPVTRAAALGQSIERIHGRLAEIRRLARDPDHQAQAAAFLDQAQALGAQLAEIHVLFPEASSEAAGFRTTPSKR